MRIEANKFYKLRNGFVVGPTERWNPILTIAPTPEALATPDAPSHLTFMADGVSTWKPECDAIAKVRKPRR